jgi:hypothetical protein
MKALILATLLLLVTFSISQAQASRIYGPFASTSSDSGTCGNVWANDTFDRYFHVMTTPNSNSTYTVTEQFKRGSFITLAGRSPGGCDPKGVAGGTVGAGISGEMQGKFTVIVSNGVYDPNANCYATATTCDTTAKFVTVVFGTTATYDVPSFLLNYNAGPNGDWKNASADKGGNEGDITGNL